MLLKYYEWNWKLLFISVGQLYVNECFLEWVPIFVQFGLVSFDFNQFSSISFGSTQLRWVSFSFVYFHPVSSSFVRFYSASSIFVEFCLISFGFIQVCLVSFSWLVEFKLLRPSEVIQSRPQRIPSNFPVDIIHRTWTHSIYSTTKSIHFVI